MITLFKKSGESTVDYKAIRTQTNVKELNSNIKKAINLAYDYAKKMDYTIKCDSKEISKIKFNGLNSKGLYKNRQKKIAKYVSYFLSKPTMKKFNTLFYMISKHNGDSRVKMVKGVKEQTIDSKRKVFKDLVVKMLEAKQEYLDEKGDFYKNRL